jgi:hypothetical protein
MTLAGRARPLSNRLINPSRHRKALLAITFACRGAQSRNSCSKKESRYCESQAPGGPGRDFPPSGSCANERLDGYCWSSFVFDEKHKVPDSYALPTLIRISPTVGIGERMAWRTPRRHEASRQRKIRVRELIGDFDWPALYPMEYYGRPQKGARVGPSGE